jgi:copper chaperone CopZ
MIRFAGLAIIVAVLCGCVRQSSDVIETGTAATPVAFNVSGAPTVEFSVPDMMCPTSCVAKTKEILSQQPGAKEVRVDFDTKTATVAVDSSEFNSQQAIAALVDHGFDHSTVKSDAAKSEAPRAGDSSGSTVEQPPSTSHSG